MNSPSRQAPSTPPATPDRNKFYSRQDESLGQSPAPRQPDFPTHHLLGNLDSLRTSRPLPQLFSRASDGSKMRRQSK